MSGTSVEAADYCFTGERIYFEQGPSVKRIIFYFPIDFKRSSSYDAIITVPPNPATSCSGGECIQTAIFEGYSFGEPVIVLPVSAGPLCEVAVTISLQETPGIAFDAPMRVDDTSHIDAGLVIVFDVIDDQTAFIPAIQVQGGYSVRVNGAARPFVVAESVDDSHRIIIRKRIDMVRFCDIDGLQDFVLIFRKKDRSIAEPLASSSLGDRGWECVEVENPLQDKVLPTIFLFGEILL